MIFLLVVRSGLYTQNMPRTMIKVWLRGSTNVKKELHPKKIMLSFWWEVYGLIFLRMLPNDNSITTDFNYAELDRLKIEIKKIRLQNDQLFF